MAEVASTEVEALDAGCSNEGSGIARSGTISRSDLGDLGLSELRDGGCSVAQELKDGSDPRSLIKWPLLHGRSDNDLTVAARHDGGTSDPLRGI